MNNSMTIKVTNIAKKGNMRFFFAFSGMQHMADFDR